MFKCKGKYKGKRLSHYKVQCLRGSGTFGEVYRAKDLNTGKKVAIKILKEEHRSEYASFWKEALTLAKLKRHSNIVHILDSNFQGELPYIVMEFAPGGSLLDRHPFSLPRVVAYTKQVAAALQYAHNEDVVHHDVKPANLLIGENGQILLTDFGVAEANHSTVRARSEIHKDGTPAYMPPEKITKGLSRRAGDQYSLAVMVYQWLTGRFPFETLQEMIYSPAPSVHTLVKVPPAVSEVVQRGMAKDPDDRYSSVQAFANALEEAASVQVRNPVRDSILILVWSTILTVISLILGNLGKTSFQMIGGPGHTTLIGPNNIYLILLVFGVLPLAPQLAGKVLGMWRGAVVALLYLLALNIASRIALPSLISLPTMLHDMFISSPIVPVAAAVGFLYTSARENTRALIGEKQEKLGCLLAGGVSFAAAAVFWCLAIVLANGLSMVGEDIVAALMLAIPIGLVGSLLDILIFNALLWKKDGQMFYPQKIVTIGGVVLLLLVLIGGVSFLASHPLFGPTYHVSDLQVQASGNTLDSYWGGDGNEHINYISGDGHVHELAGKPGGNWGNNDLTALSKGTAAMAGSVLDGYWGSNNSELVNFIGADGHVHELSISSGGTWTDNNLTSSSGGAAPATGSALSGYMGTDGSIHLNFISGDGHVHELIWSGGWSDNDLTALSRGAAAVAGSGLAGYLGGDSTIHVNFISGDGHVHELYWSNGWSDNDLTASTGGIAASSGSGLAGFVGSNSSIHVSFIGTDGHVHDLIWSNSWSDNDLTASSGGAATTSNSALSGYMGSDGSAHVNFIGADGHVHELSLSSGGGNWGDNDLTALSNGTTPTSGSILAGYFSNDNNEYVSYIGSDKRIYEVYS